MISEAIDKQIIVRDVARPLEGKLIGVYTSPIPFSRVKVNKVLPIFSVSTSHARWSARVGLNYSQRPFMFAETNKPNTPCAHPLHYGSQEMLFLLRRGISSLKIDIVQKAPTHSSDYRSKAVRIDARTNQFRTLSRGINLSYLRCDRISALDEDGNEEKDNRLKLPPVVFLPYSVPPEKQNLRHTCSRRSPAKVIWCV